MIDSSANVGTSGFIKTKEFLKTVIPYYSFDTNRVSITEFTDKATTPLRLSSVTSSQQLMDRLDAVQYRGGKNVKLSSGLEKAEEELRSVASSAEYVVLITASTVTDPVERAQANTLKSRLERSGVKVIVVGVGDSVDTTYLTQLSSDSQIYRPDSFDHLIGSVESLQKDLCNRA